MTGFDVANAGPGSICSLRRLIIAFGFGDSDFERRKETQ